MPDNIQEIPSLIQRIYKITNRLHELFPERRFTPDGHLVGSIGEIIAAYKYNLHLLPNSTPIHDAETEDGCLVQIKATQGNSVGIRSKPEHLIVLKIQKDGTSIEVYNGPGELAWNNAGKMQSNGQKNIFLTRLKDLMKEVLGQSKIKIVNEN